MVKGKEQRKDEGIAMREKKSGRRGNGVMRVMTREWQR